jgi:hypothetical protein
MVMSTITTSITPLEYANLRDVLARQKIVLDVEPKAHQIKVGRDMQNGQRDPSKQTNGRQSEEPRQRARGVAGKRRCRQRHRQGHEQQRQPRRPLGGTKHRSQERLSLAYQSACSEKRGGMQQQRRYRSAGEARGRHRPIRGGGERHAELAFQVLDGGLPHAAKIT